MTSPLKYSTVFGSYDSPCCISAGIRFAGRFCLFLGVTDRILPDGAIWQARFAGIFNGALAGIFMGA